LYFPVTDRVFQPEVPSTELIPSDGRETVLLVEDDNAVRGFVGQVLQNCGYMVLSAGDAEEALDKSRTLKEPIHLLLSDVVMPGMGGRPLAEILLSERPELKVLFISGYTGDEGLPEGFPGSGRDFLSKPFSPGELAQKVRLVLDTPSTGQA
jgi:CheY-like chemotaxis protein